MFGALQKFAFLGFLRLVGLCLDAGLGGVPKSFPVLRFDFGFVGYEVGFTAWCFHDLIAGVWLSGLLGLYLHWVLWVIGLCFGGFGMIKIVVCS